MPKNDTNIEVNVPFTGFNRSMFFNRFRIENLGVDRIAFFALLSDSGVLLDSFVCFFSRSVLDQNKDALLKYADKLPSSDVPQPAWGAQPGGHVPVVDFIQTSHGQDAEIALSNFAFGPALIANRQKDKATSIPGQPLAILRSAVSLQRSFLFGLYE